MRIDQILENKRDGIELTEAQIQYFIRGICDGSISRPQAAAFCAFVFWRGMTPCETVYLTAAMAASGDRLQWSREEGQMIIDKHSTGGVGDKVSLILAPLWATLGAKVPMISGRGLAHTGGTLDKLESIPGFRTDLSEEQLKDIYDRVGCFINGQTGELAPADKILYALRNETSTISCIPLIVGSIISKKLAEGTNSLVLDVKYGSGAFMKNRTSAHQLGCALEKVGTGVGLKMRTVLSDMNQPLGKAVGNALEVEESMLCLQGKGPQDLHDIVCELAGDPRASEVLSSGAAYAKWEEMVAAQGGDLSVPLHGGGCSEMLIRADRSGVITQCDAYNIGYSTVVLGGGRSQADQPIHHGVGCMVEAKVGDSVQAGDVLVRVLHHDGLGLEEAERYIQTAYQIE